MKTKASDKNYHQEVRHLAEACRLGASALEPRVAVVEFNRH
jgi:hypothetical protein